MPKKTPKRGRPRKPDSEKRQRVVTTASPEEIRKLTKLGGTAAAGLRLAVEHAVKRMR